jgi:hypothetical protein
MSKISGSHGGEYEDACLLGFSAVWTCRWIPVSEEYTAYMFRAICFFRNVGVYLKCTQLYHPEEQYRRSLFSRLRRVYTSGRREMFRAKCSSLVAFICHCVNDASVVSFRNDPTRVLL